MMVLPIAFNQKLKKTAKIPKPGTADVLAQIQTALVPNESRDLYSYISNDNKIKRFKSHWSSSKRQILSWSF